MTEKPAEITQERVEVSEQSMGSVHDQKAGVDTVHDAATHGHEAMDRYGHALITFDPKEEARLRRKIDVYIVPLVALLYMLCFIDRANIGNARLAGFEKDLKLQGLQYNSVLSIFYISYIVFAIPSNMACKWIGPGRFLPGVTFAFGIVTVCMAFVRNFSAACGLRFLLGFFESGILSGIAYYLSRWYRAKELALRLGFYVVMAPLSGAFGGLLASAILTLDHFGSTRRWEMIFAIEGIVTIGIAIICFFTLTDRPETARWLSQAEKDLAVARIKSERVQTSDVVGGMNKQQMKRGVLNPVVLANGWIFLLVNITAQGLAFFAPTIVRTIYPHHTVVSLQLYSVPPFAVGAVSTLVVCWLSSRYGKYLHFYLICAAVVLVGYIIFIATLDTSTRYASTFIMAAGIFPFASLCNAFTSANVVSDSARASAIGTSATLANIGGLIATWSFLPYDAPVYHIGSGLNVATSSLIIITTGLMWWWMVFDNRKRESRNIDEEASGLSTKDIQDLDWKYVAFRWAF